MASRESVATAIRSAFANTPYPGDAFLVGSTEGCEPENEVGPFRGHTDRDRLDPALLDGHYAALSFFSEGAFRFFLPCYLLADLDNRLQTADPVFHLTGGFSEVAITMEVSGRTFTRRSGRTQFVNPRRFGAMTSCDYARFRLSVFTREEAGAIVAYLEFKRDEDPGRPDRAAIDEAVDRYWRERARSAPVAAALDAHLAADDEYMTALRERTRRDHG